MIKVRKARQEDISYAVEVNKEIEGGHAGLTRERLMADLFSNSPKATILIAEDEAGNQVGLALYSTVYWASDGEILWVSQLYIKPSHRTGGPLRTFFRAIQNEAKRLQCSHIVWGSQRSSVKTGRIWKKLAKSDLSDHFSFWCKKVQ